MLPFWGMRVAMQWVHTGVEEDGNQVAYADDAQIRSVERAMALIRAIQHHSQGVTITDLARELAIPKSSVYRLLATLSRQNWVVATPDTGRYRLGLGLLEVGAQALSTLNVREVARPHLEKLWRESRETVHLGVPDGTEVIYVAKYESPETIRLYSEVGRRAPLFCTGLGKALLMAMTEKTRETLIAQIAFSPRTSHTLTDASALRQDLAAAQARGYAIDDTEHEEGVRCAACAFGSEEGTFAAISIAGPEFRMTDERITELGRRVAEECAALTARLKAFPSGSLPV